MLLINTERLNFAFSFLRVFFFFSFFCYFYPSFHLKEQLAKFLLVFFSLHGKLLNTFRKVTLHICYWLMQLCNLIERPWSVCNEIPSIKMNIKNLVMD